MRSGQGDGRDSDVLLKCVRAPPAHESDAFSRVPIGSSPRGGPNPETMGSDVMRRVLNEIEAETEILGDERSSESSQGR